MPKKPRKQPAASPGIIAEIEAMYAAYKATQAEVKMVAFDQLPLVVRRALSASQFNWNVEDLLHLYRHSRMTAWDLARYIKREDRVRLRDRE